MNNIPQNTPIAIKDSNSDYYDISGNYYKGLNKEQSIALFEKFINQCPFLAYDLDLQPYGVSNYLWHPCIAMSFVLTRKEVARLYPRINI